MFDTPFFKGRVKKKAWFQNPSGLNSGRNIGLLLGFFWGMLPMFQFPKNLPPQTSRIPVELESHVEAIDATLVTPRSAPVETNGSTAPRSPGNKPPPPHLRWWQEEFL